MSKIADVEANATSLDSLVNDNALVTTLRNGPKPSYQYLVDGWNTEFNLMLDQYKESRGFNTKGTFADGFTYELPNDVGLDASGNPWILIDTSSLPVIVSAGTTPTNPPYKQVIYDNAATLISQHNSDATAHPELSAFITDEADRAETAADVAMTAGWVYPDVTSGEAARVDGDYFWVVSADDYEVLELWLMGISTATDTGKRTISKSAVDVIGDSLAETRNAFNFTPAKNIFNKTLAEDGKIYSYNRGVDQVFANGAVSGKQPVLEGVTYTISSSLADRGFLTSIYFWNAQGDYLGMSSPAFGTPPAIFDVGIVVNDVINVDSARTLTFTVPSGEGIAYAGFLIWNPYSAHSTAEFEAMVDGIQLEVGASKTEFEPSFDGAVTRPQLKKEALPSDISPQPTTSEKKRMTLVKSGNSVYIRGKLTTTHDIVTLVDLSSGGNETVNHQATKKAPNTIADTAIAYNNGTLIQSGADDSAPLQYNNTYMGANHACSSLRVVTSTGHGKTVADVGSEWIDGNSNKFYLMKVVDVDTLWFLSENKSVYPLWSFTASISGSLTHSLGAANTASITVESITSGQMYPCHKNEVKTILIDGYIDVSEDGEYQCDFVQIVDTYSIVNPAGVIEYFKTNAGNWTEQPSFVHSSIDDNVRRYLTYTYAENCSCHVNDGVLFMRAANLNYFGSTQAGVISIGSGDRNIQYIPKTLPIVGGLKTWDLQAGEDISGELEALHVDEVYFSDANNPPDRMAQIRQSSTGLNSTGMVLGYSPIRSVGLPETRKTLINQGMFVHTSRKQYPKAVTNKTVAYGDYYEVAAFRSYFDMGGVPLPTVRAWYRDGTDIIYMLDFHALVTFYGAAVEPFMVGKNVEVIDKSASATLHGNGLVTSGGLRVSSSGSYGYLVLRIY